jgi:cytochrome c-type biogenesis protein CcmF
VIPELGHLALILALGLALVQCILPLAGAKRGIVGWMDTARPAAYGQCLFLCVAFVCLAASFLAHDFSVL